MSHKNDNNIIIAKYYFTLGAYENTLSDGLCKIAWLGADEWLYGDHNAKTSSVDYVDCLFHGGKSLLVQRKITHFCLPEFVQQNVS